MRNDILGWGLIIVLALAAVAAANGGASDTDWSVLGLGMYLFGIWGGIRLIKSA